MATGRLLPALCCLALLAGCASRPDTCPWGSRVRLLPPGGRFERALVAAATDPRTWVPAAGAVVFAATPLDDRVQEWAAEETPVFGSNPNADEVSSAFREANVVLANVTSLATPSGTRPGAWTWNKAKGLLVQNAATNIAAGATVVIKDSTSRRRPDGSDRDSFPSGHAAVAAANGAATRRNLEYLRIPRQARVVTNVATDAFTALSSWGRVEANVHYPSDVLAGAAIGNFVTVFLYDSWIGRAGTGSRWRAGAGPSSRGVAVSIGCDF